MATDLKIGSLNVRGLGERQKQREIFNWLRAKKFSIYLLQETHSSENTTTTWCSEWGYKTFFSSCSSARGGVAIFFNNYFAFQLLRSYSDPKGRLIICDIKTCKKISPWLQSTCQTRTTQIFLTSCLVISKTFSARI